jgi:hypothetical protein
MTRFPVQSRASTPAIVAAGAISLLLHAGLGVGLAKYRVPAQAGASDMDLGVEVLLPAEGTGLPSQAALPPPPVEQNRPPTEPDPAARLNLAAAIPAPASTAQQPQQLEPPPPIPEEEVIRLGTDDGVGITDNMLGSAQATPHSAMQGSVDQPALSLAPGAPGPTGDQAAQPSADAAEAGEGGADGQNGGNTQEQPATAQQPPPPEPAPPQEPQPVAPAPQPQTPAEVVQAETTPPEPQPAEPSPPAPAAPAIAPEAAAITPPREAPAPTSPESVFSPDNQAPAPQDQPDNVFALPQPQPVIVIDEFGEQAAPPAPGPDAAVPPPPSEPPAPEPEPTPAQPAADPLREQAKISLTPLAPVAPATPAVSSPAPGAAGSPAATGGDSRLPGVTSDAESIAVSTQPMLEFKPGTPLTGKGIRIRTVVPRFSTTTQLTAVPRNPIIVIRFNRAGRVVKAEFENNQGTGYRDVDEPLLDAVYRWTAVGEQLSRIPAGANETLTFRIRYLLNDD